MKTVLASGPSSRSIAMTSSRPALPAVAAGLPACRHGSAGLLPLGRLLVAPGDQLVEVHHAAGPAGLLPVVVQLVGQPAVQLAGGVGLEQLAEGLFQLLVVAGGELVGHVVAVAGGRLRLVAAAAAADLAVVVVGHV